MKKRDYKQLMQQKKRNKNYAKMAILGALGLGIGLANSDIVNAEEWVANTTTSIKQGDTDYVIKWGDYLELISKDSGLTIDTLMGLNDNIINADLIYAGNIIYFGDGVNVIAKDSTGNVIASTELTDADKAGIKEAQSSNNTNAQSSTSNKQDNTLTNTNTTSNNSTTSNTSNNNVTNTNTDSDNSTTTNTNKPSTPNNDNGNTGNGNNKPTEKPELPTNPTDPSTPATEMDVKVGFTTEGTVVATKTIKGNIDGDFVEVSVTEADIPTGYELDDDATKEMSVAQAQSGEMLSFNIRKVDETPTPSEKVLVRVRYTDTSGNDLAQGKDLEVEKGTLVTETAIEIEGYELVGEATQSVVANSNTRINFKYTEVEDTKPVEPTHTEETVVVNVDTDGNVLSSTNGYTYVSESTDNGVTTTAENGDTHTVFTKTVVWAKDYVPTHEDKYVTVNVDTNGNVLASTDGYDYVSESVTENTVTAENGDTVTTYTTTVVWSKKEVAPENPYMGQSAEVIRGEYNGTFYEGMGNSGMVWDDQMTASMWAITELSNNHGGDGSYLTWQVRVKGSNAIKWTVQLLPN